MRCDELAGLRLIGLAGNIGSGKTLAAAMVPGAVAIQWADPIYRGLAAMLDVPEDILRDRTTRERPVTVSGLEIVSRQLARTLGTEWGRDMVHPDLWVRLTAARVARIAAATGRATFAICGTRFLNELATVRENGGQVWWIERPGTVTGPHASDRTLVREHCDRALINDGTTEQLRHRIESAWSAYLEKSLCRAG
jgi:hypothetical protein